MKSAGIPLDRQISHHSRCCPTSLGNLHGLVSETEEKIRIGTEGSRSEVLILRGDAVYLKGDVEMMIRSQRFHVFHRPGYQLTE